MQRACQRSHGSGVRRREPLLLRSIVSWDRLIGMIVKASQDRGKRQTRLRRLRVRRRVRVRVLLSCAARSAAAGRRPRAGGERCGWTWPVVSGVRLGRARVCVRCACAPAGRACGNLRRVRSGSARRRLRPLCSRLCLSVLFPAYEDLNILMLIHCSILHYSFHGIVLPSQRFRFLRRSVASLLQGSACPSTVYRATVSVYR